MISPSMTDGKKSFIPHYPVAVTLLNAHQTTRTLTYKCSLAKSPAAEFTLIKRGHHLLKAFNKFQALSHLHCFQIASTRSCKRKIMEEKLGRKKKTQNEDQRH